MVTWVVGLNMAIALALLLLAQQLWRLRHTLVQVNSSLAELEQNSRLALRDAQATLAHDQQQLQQLGGQYRHTNQQLKQLKQVLLLLSWLQGYAQGQNKNQRQNGSRGRNGNQGWNGSQGM